MNKEIIVLDGEEEVLVRFKDNRMPEYFIQWFNEVGRESFEAALVDIN